MENELVICEWIGLCKKEHQFFCPHAEVHDKWPDCDHSYCTFFGTEADEVSIETHCIIIDDQVWKKKNG